MSRVNVSRESISTWFAALAGKAKVFYHLVVDQVFSSTREERAPLVGGMARSDKTERLEASSKGMSPRA